MIAGVVILLGVLLLWIGFTGRGNDFWQSLTGMEFKPLG